MRKYTTLSEIKSDIQSGAITCSSLVKQYLQNISEKKHLNAFLEVFADEAIEKATLTDKKISEGKAGKLAGMVIGLKDNICYKDHKVSASSKILEGFTSLYSATVVERLLAEDAIIIGRLNCDEFAMGASNENSAYGKVLNNIDNSRVPGGSSGGAAVAVQANLCFATLGSDTGGSVRQPASFNGVLGFKPTYGAVSRYGLIAYASSLDQISPVTNSVEDLQLIMEIIAGADGMDATLSSRPVPAFTETKLEKKNLRIAYLKDCLESEGLDPEIKKDFEEKMELLRKQGHTVDSVDFPYLDYMVPTYYILTTAEASSNLSRFSGLHYGYRSSNATDMESTFRKSRTEGFGEEVKRRIMLGTFVLTSEYYDSYYTKAQQLRRLIADKTSEILADHDFIMIPTAPTTAFKFGEKTNNPIAMYLADIFTVQAPLAGVPAISIPAGIHSNGMPFGIQVIAGKFEDAALMAFSKELMYTYSGSQKGF